MDISIIIVSYNVKSFLEQAIRTVLDAASGLTKEVFIVDNASSDGSVEMVKSMYSDVTLIENDENVGFARATNMALRLVKGDYILLLNPDTIVHKDAIRKMLDFFKETPDAGAVGVKIINPDGSLQLACRRGFPTPGVAFFKIVGLSGLFPQSRIFGGYNLTYLDPDEVHEVDALSGSFMMFTRQVLEDVGYLDEDFFMYGEDLDYCYRIKKAGWKIYYVPHAEIIHFKGESVKKLTLLRSLWIFYNAMNVFVSKHFKGQFLLFPRWLISLGIILRFLWSGIVVAAHAAAIPTVDLLLVNISLMISVYMRFHSDLADLLLPLYDWLGLTQYEMPRFTLFQVTSILVFYSLIYIGSLFFAGSYGGYRYSVKRAVSGTSIGFVFVIFIVFFLRYNVSVLEQYNLSRLVALYSWALNVLFISGWRMAMHRLVTKRTGTSLGKKRILVVGVGKLGRIFTDVVQNNPHLGYEVVGFVDPGVGKRGESVDGFHVLGLLDDLGNLINQYRIDEVILATQNIPYSEILKIGSGFHFHRPRFLMIPDSFEHMNLERISRLPLINLTPES